MVTVKEKFPHLADGNVDLPAWLEKIKTLHQIDNIELLSKACSLADSASKGLSTLYGQPCIEQGLEMAELILDLKLDQEAVAAAVINSTAQHTDLSPETISTQLSEGVAKLIAGVNEMNAIRNVHKPTEKNRDHTQIDRLRKMVLSMVSDIRVVLIKLAERTCLMRGIKNINPDERKRLAQETMDIYAPLANRLGIGQIKWELEDLAFHYIDPTTYKTIAKFLAERRVDREKRIHETIERLREAFHQADIKAKISGRAKHIYSIYLKMQRKELDYKNIYDYSAIRILVHTLEECYNALSIVHSLWEHIPEEFDDYIAKPKANGYRSVHTAVIGQDGKNLEIQIRTTNMHEEAELGVAAHWIYKENKPAQSGYESKVTFLRQLLDWHKDVAAQEVKPDKQQLEDRVYVFTPAGDIIDLAIGATPLDFAYHVHSGLGNRCRGAKINGHIVPLTYQLRTGDQVDILTVANGTPSRDWLNVEAGYIKTARARAKIAYWFRQQDLTQYSDSGKRHLEREFARVGVHHIDVQKIATRFNFKDGNALYAAIGHGNLKAAQVVHLVQEDQQAESPAFNIAHPKKEPIKVTGLSGISDLLTRIAKCCKPIPGDAILGFITQGRGVTIHKKDCNNVAHLTPEDNNRVLQVTWDNKHTGAYYVDLQIRAYGRVDILKEITALLGNAKIDLITLNSNLNKVNNIVFINLTIQIHDLEQLKHLLNQIKQLPNVIEAKRISEI